jgi:hypothetical protein
VSPLQVKAAAANRLITVPEVCAGRMSKHWDPQEDLLRTRTQGWPKLPPGATVALVLLAAACVGAAIGLYEVAGPPVVYDDATR